MLQAHNPNYLKASSPGSSRKNGTGEELKDAYDNIDEIPIAELNLDVPLKVHCKFVNSEKCRLEIYAASIIFTAKKRSDKYLEESRKSKRKEKKPESKEKRSKKKSKKSKVEAPSDSDSDEPKPIHVVNTTIEMPEGATMSDADDKNDLDVNDPHRALDINLDVDEEFYAPAKSIKSKTIVDEPEPAKAKDKSHRKKKEPESILLMESEGSVKKEKKKHKRKKETPEVDLLQTTETASAGKKEKKSKKKSTDDEKPRKHKKSSSKKSEYEEALGQVM